ncbi:hypothetical protein GQ600_26152 [Phytophthora cactorum]|nr:hypothetical protein GQ600_26152 [Phytophthora cactorum]
MKVIRRDHLALLHRVEAPTQLAAQWRTKMQTNEQSRHVMKYSTNLKHVKPFMYHASPQAERLLIFAFSRVL